jgi:hypothetical protein
MTPVKPQISEFQAEKSCSMGFNVHVTAGTLLIDIC